MYLVANMPDIYTQQAAAIAAADASGATFAGPRFGWTNSLGHALIQQAVLTIGGSKVETLNSQLLEVLDEYTTPLEKTTVVNRLIARADNGYTQTTFGNTPENTRVAVPLPFWFCRGDPGCALPIDAIIADEVRVGITFRAMNGSYYTNSRDLSGGAITGSCDSGTGLWQINNSLFYRTDVSGYYVPGISNELVSPIDGFRMPPSFALGDTYIMAEYVYLDQPEANRFRIADLQVPITQHYILEPFQTQGLPRVRIKVDIPNPVRDLYWFAQRVEAPTYNAHFLATRDLAPPNSAPGTIWWPNATGLSATQPGPLRPGFAYSDSEPIASMALMYEGSLVRMRTQAPALYRSILPSLEQKKSPWINRYYYNLPIGIQNVYTPPSRPTGEGNLDRIKNRELVLEFSPNRGSFNPNDVNRYIIHIFAETYNILRVYGGRAGLLFAYTG
jgi:hypothetical protein